MNVGVHNPFADGCAYIDGGYVPVADAKISPEVLGLPGHHVQDAPPGVQLADLRLDLGR